jgi:hypothetical protein
MENGCCRMHGGTSLAGIASATFKHGRYSKYLVGGLKKSVAELSQEVVNCCPEERSSRER